jgi:hypothetical protein
MTITATEFDDMPPEVNEILTKLAGEVGFTQDDLGKMASAIDEVFLREVDKRTSPESLLPVAQMVEFGSLVVLVSVFIRLKAIHCPAGRIGSLLTAADMLAETMKDEKEQEILEIIRPQPPVGDA